MLGLREAMVLGLMEGAIEPAGFDQIIIILSVKYIIFDEKLSF